MGSDEDERDDDPQGGVGDIDVEVSVKEGADESVVRRHVSQGYPHHGGRKREWQLNRAVDQSFPRKFVTSDDPHEDKFHDDVDRGGNKRGFDGDRIARQNS